MEKVEKRKPGRPKGSTVATREVERIMIYLPPDLAKTVREAAKARKKSITGYLEDLIAESQTKQQNNEDFFSGMSAALYCAYQWLGKYEAEQLAHELGFQSLREIAEKGGDDALLELLGDKDSKTAT